MFMTKLRTALVLPVAGAIAVGVAELAHGTWVAEPAPARDRLPAGAVLPDGNDKNLIEVHSRIDGALMAIGAEVRDGEEVPAGRTFLVRIGDEAKRYRRLEVGDTVEAEQVVARLEEVDAHQRAAFWKREAPAVRAEWEATREACDEAEGRYRTCVRLICGACKSCPSMQEVRAAKLAWDCLWRAEVSKRWELDKAEAELKTALAIIRLHEIRSPVRGVITKIYRHPGEAVRAYEPVFQVRVAGERDD
jgi:multidrug resistance efflux pump